MCGNKCGEPYDCTSLLPAIPQTTVQDNPGTTQGEDTELGVQEDKGSFGCTSHGTLQGGEISIDREPQRSIEDLL